MTRDMRCSGATLMLAFLVLLISAGAAPSRSARPASAGGLGVDVSTISPVVDHPYVPLARIKSAVYEGWELDDQSGDTVRVRSVVTVRDSAEKVVGVRATVVETVDYENGALVERSQDYFAQEPGGAVYNLAERVDDIDKGKVVGHGGQWFAGQRGARAGVLMPATPAAGGTFERERIPGVSEVRARVIRTGFAMTVPAGSYDDCVEIEISEPAAKSSYREFYARGVGKLGAVGRTISIELKSVELRASSAASELR